MLPFLDPMDSNPTDDFACKAFKLHSPRSIEHPHQTQDTATSHSDYDLDELKRDLLHECGDIQEELGSDNEDYSRAHEDGWFYADED